MEKTFDTTPMSSALDSLALLSVCSHLDLPEGVSPLTVREWNRLDQALARGGLRPAGLLGTEPAGLQARLEITEDEAGRLAALLARVDRLQNELGRLAGLGIFPLTRLDPDYPERYRQRLKESAPVVLFYAGRLDLLGQPGIAVVGSRRPDRDGEACAAFLGAACAGSGLVLVSGGAKGVDRLSMDAALEARGRVVGILADSLEKAVQTEQGLLAQGRLCLLTPYSPNAGFTVGAAMGRNRLIYAIADHAIVVASGAEQGGTWAGASEALKAGWAPVFAVDYPSMPDGNRLLIHRGALEFPYPFPASPQRLKGWLDSQAPDEKPEPFQPSFF